MAGPIIRVQGLSKRYVLSHQDTKTSSFRDAMSNNFKRFGSFINGKNENNVLFASKEEFWALKDVSFDIQPGDRIGIIGRNGAGKSTLLKILSRITEPTEGSISIHGRVASLLEVGTGFHPELSGRENIFLNGAILGMSRAEIRKKFDEIVAFAEVEKFIDTPVKWYSSGMYVRLAFAVAAHLEPEILVVDEVLAVGDAEFQKKCLGKMEDVSKGQGRTVLFVSHNMGAINQLCSKAIYLQKGQLESLDLTENIISRYLNEVNKELYAFRELTEKSNKKAQFRFVGIKKHNLENYTSQFSIGDDIEFVFSIFATTANEKKIKTAIELRTSEVTRLCNMIDVDSSFQVYCQPLAINKFKVVLKDVRFYPGTYYVSFYIGDMSSSETYDYLADILSFEILDGGSYTKRILPRSAGLLFFTPTWETITEAEATGC